MTNIIVIFHLKGPVQNSAKCFICEHLIEDIGILPCGHYFCNDCIISWINEEEKCPECSQEADCENIKGATIFMKRTFAEYKVKCAFDDCDEIQWCALIRDTNFLQKVPIVPY